MPTQTSEPPAFPRWIRDSIARVGRSRRWGPTALTVLAAALVIGGLIRLATDDRVVEVVSFREAEAKPSGLAASLAANEK